jgi:hypothetical protein
MTMIDSNYRFETTSRMVGPLSFQRPPNLDWSERSFVETTSVWPIPFPFHGTFPAEPVPSAHVYYTFGILVKSLTVGLPQKKKVDQQRSKIVESICHHLLSIQFMFCFSSFGGHLYERWKMEMIGMNWDLGNPKAWCHRLASIKPFP